MADRIQDLSKDYTRDYGGQIKKPKGVLNTQDQCLTPFYALDALNFYFEANPNATVWESAPSSQDGTPGIMHGWLNEKTSGLVVSNYGADWNFFDQTQPDPSADIQITNSPWSWKYDWIEHSINLALPFAILNPSKFLFSKEGAKLITTHGLEVIQILPRIDYYMPNRGWGGSSQLDSCWITKGLGIGERFSYCDLTDEKKSWNRMLKTSGRHVNEKRVNSKGKEIWVRVDPLADQGPLVGTPYA